MPNVAQDKDKRSTQPMLSESRNTLRQPPTQAECVANLIANMARQLANR